MKFMFAFAHSFNHSVNNWNVRNVKTMEKMFWNAKKFNQPLNLWKIEKLQCSTRMFFNAYDFDQEVCDFSNVKRKKDMYKKDTNA